MRLREFAKHNVMRDLAGCSERRNICLLECQSLRLVGSVVYFFADFVDLNFNNTHDLSNGKYVKGSH